MILKTTIFYQILLITKTPTRFAFSLPRNIENLLLFPNGNSNKTVSYVGIL